MSEIQNFILDSCLLSISAHNVQPFRLRWNGDDAVDICLDPSRVLPFADPHGKDLLMSAGALFETLKTALSTKGFSLKLVGQPEAPNSGSQPGKVATFKWSKESNLDPDPLANELPKRFSYRGAFKKQPPLLLNSIAREDLNIQFVSGAGTKQKIAKLFDRVNLKFMLLPGYVEELYSWLRFSPSHERWSRDGLNSEAMALSGIENWGASYVLKPGLFHFLNKLGLAGTLITEQPKINSAQALVSLTGPRQGAFEAGREFMRGWLALTQMGLFGAPLSLLTDDPEAIAECRKLFAIRPNDQIYNILRVGHLPEGYQMPKSARREKSELLLS